MNTKLKYILILLVAFIYVGCNEEDFLNENDPNRITEADFWQDESSVQTAMATAYGPLRGHMYGYWGAYRGFGDINSLGDDIFTITGESAHTWSVASFTNDENNEDTRVLFEEFYKSIHRSNLILDRIVDLPIDESKKSLLIKRIPRGSASGYRGKFENLKVFMTF